MAFGGVWGSAGERLLLMAGMLSWRACTPGVGGGAGGSKEGCPRVASGTCTSGEKEVPRRSSGLRSVESDSGKSSACRRR